MTEADVEEILADMCRRGAKWKVPFKPSETLKKSLVERTLQLAKLFQNWKMKGDPIYTVTRTDIENFIEANRLCEANYINTDIWFLAQVHTILKKDIHYFTSKKLYDKGALEKAKAYTTIDDHQIVDISEEYKQLDHDLNQIRHFQGKKAEEILIQERYEFPSWFRIAVTMDKDILKKYVKKARIELTVDPRIAEFLEEEKDMLPNALQRIKNG